jgi:hypothetical protein
MGFPGLDRIGLLDLLFDDLSENLQIVEIAVE